MALKTLLILLCLVAVMNTQGISSNTSKSFKLSLYGRQNQTGHLITKFFISKDSTSQLGNLNLDLSGSSAYVGTVHSLTFQGVITMPPSRPLDYEHFPGIGYYKFHHELKPFAEASSICEREGGHLAILNSDEEAAVLAGIFERDHHKTTKYPYVGVHDPFKNGDFRTVFGEKLNQTGYTKWKEGEPGDAHNQFCIYVTEKMNFGTVGCKVAGSFFCEFDISWG